jgi:hypothetical protein
MSLNFESHSFYMGAAIEKTALPTTFRHKTGWTAYIEDGVRAYSVIVLDAFTLTKLKALIREYRGVNK